MRYLLPIGVFVLIVGLVGRADAQGRGHGRRPHAEVIDPEWTRGPSRAPRIRQDRELAQISHIASDWKRAVALRDWRAQRLADRRLDVWIHRELRDSIRRPHDRRYSMRLQLIDDELRALEHQGFRGQGRRGYYARKARLLDELVALSAWQVRREHGPGRHSFGLSFAYR